MEAHEWGGSAPPRDDQGTGTQGSPVGRRSRLFDGNREFRVADHPRVLDSGLVPRKTPTAEIASEQQAMPPLSSATLRSKPHHAAELGSTPPVLHSDLPALHPDLPGSSAPLSDEHVPLPRGHAGELPRVRDRRLSKMYFPGMLQEYIRMLLRHTPLQQPTGPLQPCLRALLVSARPLLMSARPLLVSAP